MGSDAWILLLLFLLVLGLLAWPLGQLLARLIEGELPRPLQRLERLCLGAATEEMDWRRYTFAILVFNLLGGGMLFVLLLLQGVLPLNPQHLPGLSVDLALNTAVSFMTNTNWQAYAGEASLSYFSQMVGLTVQNFLSAATGGAVAFALIRGLTRHGVSDR